MGNQTTEIVLETTIIHMLNALGDLSQPCSGEHCKGCMEDSYEAWVSGLKGLGYEPNSAGWRKMMRQNYFDFPSDEQIEDSYGS